MSAVKLVAVFVENKPGQTARITNNTSGFVANNRAILIIEVHDLPQARVVLEKAGLRLLTQAEMLKL